MVQLSNPYMSTGKTIALSTWTSDGKVISLLSIMLSRFSFKEQESFNFMSVVSISVILEPKKIKSVTVSPSICHEVMEPDAMILVFF